MWIKGFYTTVIPIGVNVGSATNSAFHGKTADSLKDYYYESINKANTSQVCLPLCLVHESSGVLMLVYSIAVWLLSITLSMLLQCCSQLCFVRAVVDLTVWYLTVWWLTEDASSSEVLLRLQCVSCGWCMALEESTHQAIPPAGTWLLHAVPSAISTYVAAAATSAPSTLCPTSS